MKNRPGEKIKLTSIDELLGVPEEEAAIQIPIASIHSFKDHPFKVIDNEKMGELVQSILENGILTPVLVRPVGLMEYEMISGHRRLHAAQLAGLTELPAFVREMNDDEAVVAMVDANIQREELLPSEKAFAYKMKLNAMRRQAGRPSKENVCQSGTNLRSDQILGKQVGESARSIQRYIRLTELIPELLNMVDAKRLNFTIAVDISYIDKQTQEWLYEYIHDNGFIKPNQITALRRQLEQGPVSQQLMISVLNSCIPLKKSPRKVNLSEKKLDQYFPPNYSSADMERIILELLEAWKNNQEEN